MIEIVLIVCSLDLRHVLCELVLEHSPHVLTGVDGRAVGRHKKDLELSVGQIVAYIVRSVRTMIIEDHQHIFHGARDILNELLKKLSNGLLICSPGNL